MARIDSRDIISPDSFTVAPHLLGLPLASPTRRAVAMGLDLLLLTVLVRAGGGVLFGGAVAWVALRVALRKGGAGRVTRPVRLAVGTLGAIMLFTTASSLWDRMFDGGRRGNAAPEVRAARVRAELKVAGAFLPVDAPSSGPAAENADSLAGAYAAAVTAGDTAAAHTLRPRLALALTAGREGGELESARAEAQALRDRNRKLESELKEARKEHGLIATLILMVDELGIGFGWAALYFTAFLALWRGQTPGKRLLGVRVLRLDGKTITWWTAFERFGGYVAGFATGLLDFFLLVRDRNRQTLHDKIVDTVVVREGGSRPTS